MIGPVNVRIDDLTKTGSAAVDRGERVNLTELFHKIKCAHRDGQLACSPAFSALAPVID
jgi:hypothetical protein